MAEAITRIDRQTQNAAEEQVQAMDRLLQATAGGSEPLLKGLDILNELDRLGVLDAMRAMLKQSGQITAIGLEQMNKPGAHRIIKNAMGALQFLSSLDPAKLAVLMNGLTAGIDSATAAGTVGEAGRQERGGGGLWSIVKSMRGPDVMASLSLMVRFLQGMGRSLNKSR
ncbi:hypothetical protein BG52_12295 [Paenibacillus darwinianus]|nr:DUF1641 domain-containing protein [Paenibacillus darwinianus]EXX92470.1 hypothetical protein BG52_12295 [Paenibacillus darwinianus]